MSSLAIALVILACVFGGALLGLVLRDALPEHHLNPDSRDAVKLATGLIATIAALVLSLLISSAKSSFDRVNNEIIDNAAKVITLDRVLANYGPEARPLRESLKQRYTTQIERLTSGNPQEVDKLASPEATIEFEHAMAGLGQLAPHNETQAALKARALQIVSELGSTRALLILHKDGTIPMALLVVLTTWLTVIFSAFGLLAPRNHTVVAALFVGALSAAGAVFLILELDRPFYGLVSVPAAPLHDAAAHLGK